MEDLLPPLIIDGPIDFGLLASIQNRGPNRSIAVVGGHVEAVYHGHAQSQFAGGLHIHIVFALLGDNRRVQRYGHRHRVGQRNSMLTGLLEVSLLSATVALNREARLRCAKAQRMLNVVWVQYGFATA